MATIQSLEELAHSHFSAKHEARERSLAHARLLVRFAGTAIRAIHRRDLAAALELLAQAESEIRAIQSDLTGYPELYHHNYITDALKEFAEARLTVAFVRDEPLPLPDQVGVGYVAYFSGLTESVGELRRFILDALRRDDPATGERLLTIMDEVYVLLITLDYPDAVTGGLRRGTDGVRGILERTRGDLTTDAGQRRLERALGAARARLEGS